MYTDVLKALWKRRLCTQIAKQTTLLKKVFEICDMFTIYKYINGVIMFLHRNNFGQVGMIWSLWNSPKGKYIRESTRMLANTFSFCPLHSVRMHALHLISLTGVRCDQKLFGINFVI